MRRRQALRIAAGFGAATALSTRAAADRGVARTNWQFATDDRVSASPTIVEDTVFVGSEDHRLYALDATTGARRWAVRTDGAIHASPMVVDGVAVVATGAGTVCGIDAIEGRRVWTYQTSGPVGASPLVVGEHVIIAGEMIGDIRPNKAGAARDEDAFVLHECVSLENRHYRFGSVET